MKLKKGKKGFTLTELAIVIAVIAVLIAVLVPTFVSLINKANNSSDEQTVKNMNTALQIDEADNDKPEYLCQVWEILEEAGYNPAPTPDYTDNGFYWYKSVNRVVIVSASQNEITFPSEYAGITVTDDISASISMRLTAAKAAADSIYKSALVSMEVGEYDAQAHNYDANGECQLCNRSIADDPDHVHTYDEGVVTKEATCTEDGVITYTCYTCRHTETETIAASHTWDEGEVTAVTQSEQTCTVKYTCSVCTETKEVAGEKLDGSEARPYAITGSSKLEGGVSEAETKYYKLYGAIMNAEAITVSGYISIDLNGCTLQSSVGGIKNNGTLTIIDSSSSGGGKIYNSTTSGSVGNGTAIKNTGTLTIESGTITGTIYGIYSTAGTVTISGGTVSETDNATSTRAISVKNTTLTISGGTITTGSLSNAKAIDIDSGCIVDIQGGTIIGFTAIQVTDSTSSLSISGGTITSTSSSTYEMERLAISAVAGEVSISGGTFNGSVYIDYDVTNYSSAITGGNFSTEGYGLQGTIYYYLSSYVANGYELSSTQTGGYYTVT